MFQSNIYKKRRSALQRSLKSGIVAFLGNMDVPYNYTANIYKFRQDSNFLYFFGIDKPNLAALIDIDDNTEIVFGDNPDIEDIIWSGNQPNLNEFTKMSGIETTKPYNDFSIYLKKAVSQKREIHIAPQYRLENKAILSDILNCKPDEINSKVSINLIQTIVTLRSVKDENEIAEIEQMVDVAEIMHTTAMKFARPGVNEHEIAGMVEGICLSRAYNVSFPVICSVRGETLHNPHHTNTLHLGQLLLTDAGAESLIHYASDITRTIPVGGIFSNQQRAVYQIVLNANKKAIELASPGVTYKSIHLEAANIIADGLKQLGLMKGNTAEAVAAGAHALFFPHGLGHMLGLDVHDMESLGENFVGYTNEIERSKQFGLAYLRMARKLEPGFVVTNEPGIYFIPALIEKWKTEKLFTEFINYEALEPYKNFGGIRIEDNLLITQTGCRVLGNPIPKEIKELEALH